MKVVVIYQYIEIGEMQMIKLVLIIKHLFAIGIKIFPIFLQTVASFMHLPAVHGPLAE